MNSRDFETSSILKVTGSKIDWQNTILLSLKATLTFSIIDLSYCILTNEEIICIRKQYLFKTLVETLIQWLKIE